MMDLGDLYHEIEVNPHKYSKWKLFWMRSYWLVGVIVMGIRARFTR